MDVREDLQHLAEVLEKISKVIEVKSKRETDTVYAQLIKIREQRQFARWAEMVRALLLSDINVEAIWTAYEESEKAKLPKGVLDTDE